MMAQRPCKLFPVNPELEPEGVLFFFFPSLSFRFGVRPLAPDARDTMLYTYEIFPYSKGLQSLAKSFAQSSFDVDRFQLL